MIPPSDATSAFILIRITTQKFGTTHLLLKFIYFLLSRIIQDFLLKKIKKTDT